jgi:SP family sugar:H+ symporter-like MFS transporter
MTVHPDETTRGRYRQIWDEKRVIFICFCIALGQFQYGYDSAAIAGFQSMPGFLMIFGYEDVRSLTPPTDIRPLQL